MVVLGKYDPGIILERHGHSSDRVIYVIDGELMHRATTDPFVRAAAERARRWVR